MLRGQRLADPALALLFRIKLTHPAPDGTFTKFHIFTDLTDAQALGFDHLRYLELEARAPRARMNCYTYRRAAMAI